MGEEEEEGHSHPINLKGTTNEYPDFLRLKVSTIQPKKIPKIEVVVIKTELSLAGLHIVNLLTVDTNNKTHTTRECLFLPLPFLWLLSQEI